MNDEINLRKPQFSLNEVRLPFEIHSKINRLLITNNVAFIAIEDYIRKFSLDEPSKVTSIKIPQMTQLDQITGFWAHPRSTHLIVQLNHSLHFYLHETYTAFKAISKLNSLKITSIVFRDDSTKSRSTEFLATTRSDCVVVGTIKPHTSQSKRDDKLLKQVFRSKEKIICSCVSSSEGKVYILTKSESIVYESQDFAQELLIDVLSSNPRRSKHSEYIELLQTSVNLNHFHVISNTSFVLSNDPETLLISGTKLREKNLSPIHAFTTTRHHYIFLDEEDQITIQDKLLTNLPIHLHSNHEPGLIGICADALNGTVWIYSANSIYEITAVNEDSMVWYGYFTMGRYDEALALLEDESSSERYRNAVLIKKGYDLLQRGGFGIQSSHDDNWRVLFDLQRQGIKTLANLMEPFEKVCLLLAKAENRLDFESCYTDLLVAYLDEKLTLAIKERNCVKSKILATWSLLLRSENVHFSTSKSDIERSKDYDILGQNEKQNDLKQFLSSYHDYLESDLTLEILSKTHLVSAKTHYAMLKGDFDLILSFHLEHKNWSEAVSTLVRAIERDQTSGKELLYSTATLLLQTCPRQTVETWSKIPGLRFHRLLPAILEYVDRHNDIPLFDNYALNFLSKVIFEANCDDIVATNAYLAMIVRYPEDGQMQVTKALLRALKHFRERNLEIAYDVQMILRLAIQYGKLWPAILIMTEDLQLYETSLQLALEHKDISSAEYVLRKFERSLVEESKHSQPTSQTTSDHDGLMILDDNHQNLRKRLWLIYARFIMLQHPNLLITNGETFYEQYVSASPAHFEKVIRYLLNFSKETSSFKSPLDIKGLIAILPEYAEISEVKNDIVDSLDRYNNRIGLLASEMRELVHISSKLRNQIISVRDDLLSGQVGVIIEAGESCSLCSKLLLEKNIIVFSNCQHGFHRDCVARYHLKQRGEYRFKEIFQKFRQKNFDKSELDLMFLKQCVLCHGTNLGSIDEDLVDRQKDKLEILEWDV